MEWISVKDRLPFDNYESIPWPEKQFIIFDGEVVDILYFEYRKDKGFVWTDDDMRICKDVTHWMPFPEPPQ